MSEIKRMIEKDQIVKIKDESGMHIAVVTKILSKDYVSCIRSDGTVHACVYTGYIDPLDGTKLMLSDILANLEKFKHLEK